MLAQLDTLLPGLGLSDVTSTLTGTLDDLQGVVASLPDGAGLAGQRTLGLDVSLAAISTNVAHNRALAAGGGTGPGTTTTGTTPPGVTPPSVPGAPGSPTRSEP